MLKVAAILNFVERYSFHACTVLAHIMILYSGQCTPALAVKCALATFCLEQWFGQLTDVVMTAQLTLTIS